MISARSEERTIVARRFPGKGSVSIGSIDHRAQDRKSGGAGSRSSSVGQGALWLSQHDRQWLVWTCCSAPVSNVNPPCW